MNNHPKNNIRLSEEIHLASIYSYYLNYIRRFYNLTNSTSSTFMFSSLLSLGMQLRLYDIASLLLLNSIATHSFKMVPESSMNFEMVVMILQLDDFSTMNFCSGGSTALTSSICFFSSASFSLDRIVSSNSVLFSSS